MSRALVIGNGAAGTFSSWLLAREGWEVVMAGKGTPCTSMSTGCLRNAPRECQADILEFLSHEGMSWTSGRREGISKVGTPFHCWMSPSHSTWAEGEAPESVTVVGFDGHPSLPAKVASAVLNERGMRAAPLILPANIHSDVPLASIFRNDEAWDLLAEELGRTSSEAVLLPAIVPLQDYGRLDRLERRCGRRVLEAVTPLSVSGQRLTDIMLSKAMEAGVTIWEGRKVTALEVRGDAVRKATVLGGMEERDITVDAVVLATGGLLVDGLALNGQEVRDPFGSFQVARNEAAIRSGYVSKGSSLVSIQGLVMSNVRGAGDCLSREGRNYGRGLTEALESAYLAVKALEVA